MKKLHIDFETYSDVDLKKMGAYKYAQHHSTKVLLMAYSYGEEVNVIDFTKGQEIPTSVISDLTNPEVQKWAHNAAFERCVLQNVLNIQADPTQWRCTMAWGLSLSLPGSLEGLGQTVGLSDDKAKIKEGKALIREFCTPKGKMKPERWDLFVEYCRQDVVAEMAIASKLKKYPLGEKEWAIWATDQRVNDRGLPVDVDLVSKVEELAADFKDAKMEEAQVRTGIDNPNSPMQIIEYLSHHGVKTDSLTKESVSEILQDHSLTEEAKYILETRQLLGKSSIAKYTTLRNATCCDGRLRGTFQYYGASRTGRWAGRLFQPQNLPRPTIGDEQISKFRKMVGVYSVEMLADEFNPLPGAISSSIRSMIVAPEGKQLVVCDFSSIESIMIAWCAESQKMLKLFHEGLDPYKDFATQVYQVPYEEVTKEQRTLCKPAVLGAGYGLAGPGLQRYAEGFGINMGPYEAQKQITVFRTRYSDIVDFWLLMDQSIAECLKTKGQVVEAGRFKLYFDGLFMFIYMPSGRSLHYYKPKMEINQKGKLALHYVGGKDGGRISTHHGKITENIVQAISRDILAEALLNVEKIPSLEIVGHVHDEILCLADKDDTEALNNLQKAMVTLPKWCLDAPIKAEGYQGAEYYKK